MWKKPGSPCKAGRIGKTGKAQGHCYTEYRRTSSGRGKQGSLGTSWSRPESVIAALAAKYPDLSFEHKWADEDFGYNVGHLEYEDGEEMFCDIPPGGSKEALEMAAEIHDVDLADEGYLYNEKTGEYEYHNPDESMSLKI